MGARSGREALAPAPPAERAATLWVAALDDEIDRARRGGSPLSLLLVELEDAERIVSSESGADATAAFGSFARAVRTVLRRQDLLASEAEDRAWVIARDTGRGGATALATRIAAAVRAGGSLRGAPLRVSIGVAVLGEDAVDCAGLLEAAEEASLMAAAGGIEVAEVGLLPGEDADRD